MEQERKIVVYTKRDSNGMFPWTLLQWHIVGKEWFNIGSGWALTQIDAFKEAQSLEKLLKN